MKFHRHLFIVITMVLTFIFALMGPAAIASKTSTSPKAAPATNDIRKLIKSVDMASSTVTIQFMSSKTEEIYNIDSLTAITVNGSPGTLGDIHAGMQAVDLLERDGHTLDGLSVNKTDPAPVAPATKAKKKKKTAST